MAKLEDKGYTKIFEYTEADAESEKGAPKVEELKLEPVPVPDLEEGVSLADVQKELREAEEARDKFKKELDEALATADKYKKDRDDLAITYEFEKANMEKDYNELEETYRDVKDKLAELENEKVDTDTDKAEVEKLKTDLNAANSEKTELKIQLDAANNTIVCLQAELDEAKLNLAQAKAGAKDPADAAESGDLATDVWEKLISDDEKIIADQLADMVRVAEEEMGARLNIILSDRAKRFEAARGRQITANELSQEEKELAEKKANNKEEARKLEEEERALEAKKKAFEAEKA